MSSKNYGLYAIALAIVVVGALWIGLPVGTLAVFGLIAMCPVMMFFMMRGMRGNSGDDRHDSSTGSSDPHDHNIIR